MDRIEKIRENLKAIGNFLSLDLRQHITWVHESYIKDVNNLLSALEEKEKKIKRLKDSAAIDLDVARDLIRERDQAELTMAKLRAQLVDAITDKEEAERRYTNCLEEKEKELESWRGSRDGVLEQITECEYRELQAEAKYKACHEELIRCNNDLIECRKVALHRPCPILFTVIKPC